MIHRGHRPASSQGGRAALSPAQWAIYEAGWDATARFRVAVCGRRFGKALALDTPLASPDGWTTMGEVEVGTRLFDEHGRICAVTYATDIMIGRPCNRMVFDDGSVIVADDEHLWPVRQGCAQIDTLLTTRQIALAMRQGGGFTILDRLLSGATDTVHGIRSVQAARTRPVRCIQVDSPSRLYLCGHSKVPTHNTFLMAEELRRAARLAVAGNVGTENEIWYGAPTFLQAKRVMWGRLKRTIPRSWMDGAPAETDCSIRLRSGHVIRLIGLDASENLRGSGLWFFGGDEWADCRPSAWLEVIRPMLSTARGHALFIGTPKGFDHLRDAYILGQPGGDPSYRSFLFTTAEGGHVPLSELQSAEKELDPRVFRQEYGASFETYAGRVVYAFSRAENVRRCAYDQSVPLHVGIDFNVNPMSATVWQEDGDTTRQIDEIILPTSNTDEMADEIAKRFGREGFEPGRRLVDHITVYPDPAGAQRRSSAGGRTDIGILREKGFVVSALRAHPPVRDRMNVINRQFRTADGAILATVDPRCRQSIEAYERLIYREGSNEPDKTQGFDHLVDASGYYLFGRRAVNSVTASANAFMER
ncbi:hypothetical protein [Lichenicola sp.]|uniref:hypothetical protein n=1 Tax=Lichenicola sp. TaxID=2804529 RepID=UPI003AFFBAE0